jgi:uncharacterized protein
MVRNYDQLLAWFANFRSVAVAFSGGVDSTLVLKAAHEALCAQAVALLAVSPSLPLREKEEARLQAAEFGCELVEISTSEVDAADYQRNGPDRCFFCKDHVYRSLGAAAAQRGFELLVDGMNADDTLDVRPGRAAARQQGVRSPLCELGLTKADVREIARGQGLSVWDKPAAACLASRVPYGMPVTPALLAQIEMAENALAALGFREFRVRHHGNLARVEIAEPDLPRAFSLRQEIGDALRRCGYVYVSLDLDGFRSGSANEVLPGRQPARAS